ncbi:MAG: GDP-mannose 4,6 dehydratase, partial [Chloroflexaceae bacterium]|nr:GDP-mannose 4,6 dehydratase [Chloroflexaceae bacterium]
EIGTLLNQLVAMSHVPITVSVDPARLRPVDVPDVVCDNHRLRTATGWRPQISLATTLHDMLNYWRHAIKETQA